MSRPRQETAIGAPPPDLASFPKWRLRPNFILTRAHRAGLSPWWFSSDLSGRFDLVGPHGTCYLATDTATALRERFGHDLVEQGVVTWKAAQNTAVSRLQVPSGRWLANCCHDDAASHGATRELGGDSVVVLEHGGPEIGGDLPRRVGIAKELAKDELSGNHGPARAAARDAATA